MPKPDPKAILSRATSYLKEHPEEIIRAAKGMLGLRIGVPLDALRYFAKELGGGKKMPKDIEIESAPPGVKIAMTVDAVGSTLRVSLVVNVEEIHISADEIRIGTRISDLSLKVLDGFQTPVAALVQSGALDLSKPGNLVAFIPKRPPMIVDAKDDRIVIDAGAYQPTRWTASRPLAASLSSAPRRPRRGCRRSRRRGARRGGRPCS